jgi:heptosyltransferase-1
VPQKILLIKLSALGDIVHALPALHYLKDNAPNLEIDWFSYQGFSALLQDQTAIHELITLKDRELGSLIHAIQVLRSKHYDLVIDMQGLIKTATLAKLSGARVLGFAQPREAAASLLYDHSIDIGIWNSNENHVIENNIKLAEAALKILKITTKPSKIKYGLVATEPSRETKSPIKTKIQEVCFLPATTWESKFWPNEYWVELAQRLYQKYKSNIHIVCTKHDDEIIQPLLAQLKEACISVTLHQEFKLDQLPSFFRSMDLIVGVDTGPLHIAAATVDPSTTEILGIYGPTSPRRSGPYGFRTVSAEDLFEHKPMNKRRLSDDASMRTILPELVLSRLLGSVRV